MRPAMDATLRGHKPAVAIFLRAALVISWADIPGRRRSRKHSALALVMQSIKRSPAMNAIRSERECRSEGKSRRRNRSTITQQVAGKVALLAMTASARSAVMISLPANVATLDPRGVFDVTKNLGSKGV
jgi:hypothetical protein